MSINKTLVIMAAGLATRYGGGKQTAAFGPNGEMLMEYSIADAKKAGFHRVVIIVSKNMSDQFRSDIQEHVKGIDVAYAVQDFANLPDWFSLPEGRTKPYGTVHAVLSAKHLLDEPFAIINADDYYGYDAMQAISSLLDSLPESGEGGMVAYPILNTLSAFGSVTRGVCKISDVGSYLEGVVETRNIQLNGDGVVTNTDDSGALVTIPSNALVSMNIFGFTPSILHALEEMFYESLRAGCDSPLTAEYPIPVFIDNLIGSDRLKVHVTQTDSEWFGVTYPQDAASVKARLLDMPSPRA